MALSCLGKMPRWNRLGCIRLPATMHEAGENLPWRRALSCPAFPWSPSLVTRWNSLESSHPGVISPSSSSMQMNVTKIPKPPCTLDTQTTQTRGCVSLGCVFRIYLVLEGRALTPAGASLFSHRGVSLLPFPAVTVTLSCLCPHHPARARRRPQSAVTLCHWGGL